MFGGLFFGLGHHMLILCQRPESTYSLSLHLQKGSWIRSILTLGLDLDEKEMEFEKIEDSMIENLKEREKKNVEKVEKEAKNQKEAKKAEVVLKAVATTDKPPKDMEKKTPDATAVDIEDESKAQIDMELMRKKKWLTWKFVGFSNMQSSFTFTQHFLGCSCGNESPNDRTQSTDDCLHRSWIGLL